MGTGKQKPKGISYIRKENGFWTGKFGESGVCVFIFMEPGYYACF